MKQAMIFAAGLGTRLKPLTDTMPKALVSVGGQPLLWHVIMKLRAAGYQRIVVNVHHFAQQIVDYLHANQNFGLDIRISDETGCLLETGGGLKKAQTLFDSDSPILIHNVDILDNVDFDWFSRQHLPAEDAVLLVSRRSTQRYLLFNNAMRLMGWKNTATGQLKSPYEYVRRTGLSHHGEALNMFAFSGIHSFSPRLFPLMERFSEKLRAEGEDSAERFSIMDFYLSVCHRSSVVGLLKDDLKLIDVGKLDTLDAAEQFLSLQ